MNRLVVEQHNCYTEADDNCSGSAVSYPGTFHLEQRGSTNKMYDLYQFLYILWKKKSRFSTRSAKHFGLQMIVYSCLKYPITPIYALLFDDF